MLQFGRWKHWGWCCLTRPPSQAPFSQVKNILKKDDGPWVTVRRGLGQRQHSQLCETGHTWPMKTVPWIRTIQLRAYLLIFSTALNIRQLQRVLEEHYKKKKKGTRRGRQFLTLALCNFWTLDFYWSSKLYCVYIIFMVAMSVNTFILALG